MVLSFKMRETFKIHLLSKLFCGLGQAQNAAATEAQDIVQGSAVVLGLFFFGAKPLGKIARKFEENIFHSCISVFLQHELTLPRRFGRPARMFPQRLGSAAILKDIKGR